MDKPAKIAAVTGATGFVGKHLVRELLFQGYQVKALTRRPQPDKSQVNWIEGDLDDPDALTRLAGDADIFFHLAGLIKAKDPADFERVNYWPVTTIIKAIERSGSTPHFILLSSLAARERYLSSYAESKRKGEEALSLYARDLPWTILRPPGIYGPEDKETLKIFKALSAGIAPMPVNSQNRASWIYAPDLAQAMVAVALNKACFAQILDVDDGAKDGYSHKELYQTASHILGKKPLQFTVPRFFLEWGARWNVLFSTMFDYTPMVTPEKVNELCYPDWVCHGPHVRDITSWKAATSLEKGFRKTLDWYKEKKLI